MRKLPWFCRLDVRHYFESIRHETLLGVLLPMFREREVRDLAEAIIRAPYEGQESGRGMPIGNLTSQWFANLYLDGFDHFVKESLRLPGYVRYMDDMLLFAQSKAECWESYAAAREWLSDCRGLALKEGATCVGPVEAGVDVLGLRIFPWHWKFVRKRFLRCRRRLALRMREFTRGEISVSKLAECARSSEASCRAFGFKGVLRDVGPAEANGA